MGALLVSVLRMTSMLGEVRTKEIGELSLGERLHRGGWAIEVAMRHGKLECENGAPVGPIADSLHHHTEALRKLLERSSASATESLAAAAGGYVTMAEKVLERPNVCVELMRPQNLEERSKLDEAFTDAWATAMSELHTAVAEKDEEAQRVGAAALSIGGSAALAALLLGLLVAQRLSRSVTAPLGDLALVAHRVGAGDFSSPVPVAGPPEVGRLGKELDIMRSRLAELDTLKQAFLASISHEMRTPLAKIREALALLADGAAGPLNDRQARVLKIARTACEREIRTVSTLLDLSRLRAGSPLKFQAAVSVDDAIREAIEENAEVARDVDVELVADFRGDVTKRELDSAMVERAVANLLRNAIDVSRPGQKVRLLRAVETDPDGLSFAVVTVEDEGPGVPEDLRGSIFNPFVTQAVSSSPKRVGVGLGLALAREVARAHGGELELVERTLPGACFRLTLPLPAASETNSASSLPMKETV